MANRQNDNMARDRRIGFTFAFKELMGLILILFVFAVPSQSRAAANAQDIQAAESLIRNLSGEAITILEKKDISLAKREAAFRKLLKEGFDIDFLGRFALAKHWRQASEQQKMDYSRLFSDYIVKTYANRLGGYSGETFAILSARAAGKKDIMVQTEITRPSGPPIRADWRIRPRDSEYKIIDIMVEGVSLAVTQRAEFAAVVKQSGVDGLIQALHARVQKIGATNATQ